MSSTQPDSDNPAPVNPLDGFGIVTLASIYPVCFVLLTRPPTHSPTRPLTHSPTRPLTYVLR